jgi:hypothetical protein
MLQMPKLYQVTNLQRRSWTHAAWHCASVSKVSTGVKEQSAPLQ